MNNTKRISPKKKAATGTMTANFHSDAFPTFNGKAWRFITNGTTVLFVAKHEITTTDWQVIYLEFPADVQNRRHFFTGTSSVKPPLFSQQWNSGETFIPYPAKIDEGHIDFTFDLKKGTLSAEINFTLASNSVQVTAKIENAEGLEHVKQLPERDKNQQYKIY